MEQRRLRQTENAVELTPLQLQILVLVRNGLTNREIGDRLGGTAGMVATQVGRILERLGLTRRSEIVAAVNGAVPSRTDSQSQWKADVRW